jgi:D-3-phosphoglycerate dehydrogenase
MYKIHCLNNISQEGLSVLSSDYTLTDDINESDAVLVRSFNMHELNLNQQVVAVARAGAGVNNIPLDKYASQGIVVFNTPGANANAVKELTIAGMFLAARNLYPGMQWVKENNQDPDIQKNMEKAKKAFAGTEILNKTIGIIGLGAIGIMLANTCAKMGMKVLGTKRHLETLKDLDFHDNVTLVKTKEEIFEKADYISLNLPLNDNTKHLIDKKAFDQMKDGVIILNFARDKLVNDEDLEFAIKNQKVRAYVTDFPNPKTAQMEGVIAFPHLGASSEEAETNCAIMASTEISKFIETGAIKHSVNYPDISVEPKQSKYRYVVLCKVHGNDQELYIKEIVSLFERIEHVYQSFNNQYGVIIIDSNEDAITDIDQVSFVTKVRVIK